ncbi:MAG TPA: DUF4097 family beta strand repeat-containing protein [Candidatus Acidoferrum sp.]
MRARNSGLFSGLVLISVGVLLLLHNYGHLDLTHFFWRWWPLLIIFWGAVKLYERTAGRRFGGDAGTITGGEVLLVLGMLALLGTVVALDYIPKRMGIFEEARGNNFSFDVDVPPKAAPINGPVQVRNGRGDITVRSSDDGKIRVSAKKNARAWDESEAERIAKSVSVEIAQNGDAYEIRPSGYDLGDARISVDMEVAVPKKSSVSVKTEKGDIAISGTGADVSATVQLGDVDIRNTSGDVSVDTRKGDVKVADTRGDVKVSGKGGEIEAVGATGSLTIDGDFYGPVRAEHIAKGVRVLSPKTDLTLAALAGHIEMGSGNIEIVDAPGNLTLRTRDNEISVENPGGKVNIDNRNGQISVRFTAAPKDDLGITNSSSGISVTIPATSNFEVLADCRNCNIDSEFSGLQATKSESGDAHLSAKYGSGRGPKITLKTSYGNIELRRTTITMPKLPAVPAPPIPPATEQ